jgi:hypothetical protein
MLIMTSGRLLTAACEIACLDASAVPRTIQSEAPTTAAHFGCHESASAPGEDADRLSPRGTHTTCGHPEAAEPFLVASKSVADFGVQSASPARSGRTGPVASARAKQRLQERTPPGVSSARVDPLRI